MGVIDHAGRPVEREALTRTEGTLLDIRNDTSYLYDVLSEYP